MDEPTQEELLRLIRETYAASDPVPAGMVARMQTAAAGVAAETGLGLDLELMLLVETTTQAVGTRSVSPTEKDGVLGSGRAAYTLRFTHSGVDVLVRVAPDGDATSRLDGWVVPAEPMTVRVLRADDVHTPIVAVTLAGSGRFELTELPSGLVKLRFEAPDGAVFLTPTFEI